MRRFTSSVLLLTLIATASGCGDGKGAVVKGTVMLDGKAVPNGSVTFVKSEGGLVREGATITDGAFTANLPPGKYKVELNGQKLVGKRKQKGFDGKMEEIDLTEEMFPENYNSKSELSEVISAGNNTIKFDLKSKK